jgi:hypothetical protein
VSEGLLVPRAAATLPDVWSLFSHSYGDGTAGSYDQTGRIDSYLRQALDIEYTNWRKYSIAGSRLTVEGAAQGGWATLWRVSSGAKWPARSAPYAPEGGAMIMMHGINDLGTLGGATTQILTAYQHALRACISRWRASVIAENDAATGPLVPTYGGTWTAETAKYDISSSGTERFHATTGGTITLTLPADYAGEPVVMNFIGRAGVNGGIVTFSGTAGVTGTITTDNIMPSATLSNCPVVKRVTNLTSANASQTIIATVTQNSGLVYYDCAWLESKAPPPVIVCDVPRLTATGYSTKYASWVAQTASLDGDVQALNTAMASVVAEFDGMVQTAYMDAKLNKVASLFFDGLHPNETGAAMCADAIMDAVKRLSVNNSYGSIGQMNVSAQKAGVTRRPIRATTWYAPDAFGARTSYTAVAGDMFAYPFPITEARTQWSNWGVEVTTASATTAGTGRLGIFADYNYSGYPDTNLQEITISAVLSMGTTTGLKTTNAGGFIWRPDPGMYWLVYKVETIGTATNVFSAMQGPNPFLPLPTSAGLWSTGVQAVGYKLTGQATGAFASTFPTGGVVTATGPYVGMLRT